MLARKVLVVEDDDSIRQSLVDYLQERARVRVDGARDGADALHAVRTESYAVIVLDLMMPFMNGIDFLTSLEIVAAAGELPACFIITGMPPDEVPSQPLADRFPRLIRGVFRKPLHLPDLLRCVEEELNQ